MGLGAMLGDEKMGDLPPKGRAGAGAGSASHPPAPPQSPGRPLQPSLQREGEIMGRGAKKKKKDKDQGGGGLKRALVLF